MPSRTVIPHCLRRLALAACIALGATASALGQSGLRPIAAPEGLDPAFAGGWLAAEPVQLGIAGSHWRDLGYTPGQRLNWSYDFNERGSLGLAYTSARELFSPGYNAWYGAESRGFSLFGRYSLNGDWAVGAEAGSPAGSLRLNDLRIGVHRRF
jgi:hypothetical protein